MRIVKSAEVRKQEVLDCAVRLFATQGYEDTSINQIISALGISKGAFYHHYSSKEDLVEALACRYAEEAATRARNVIEDPSLDAFERLSVFLSRLRASKLEHEPGLIAAFRPLMLPGNSQLYERSQAAIASVIQPILERIIAEGVADRTFDTADAGEAAELMLHLMASTRDPLAALFQARSEPDFDRALDRLVARLRFIGTVIDRMLGIPEGSIELIDCQILDCVAGPWRQSFSAA